MNGNLKWDWWSVYWIGIWFGCLFLGPELWALLVQHRSDHTLSYQVWHLEGLTRANEATFWNPITWSIPHYLVACGCLWLCLHFMWHVWH